MSTDWIYAWFNPSLAGFIKAGCQPGRDVLEFNTCAVHFEAQRSPASVSELTQLCAIAPVRMAVSGNPAFGGAEGSVSIEGSSDSFTNSHG